jgi:putative chitinase
MNRQKFYDIIRGDLFGTLSQSQVNGIDAILNKWGLSGFTDLRWLAYMLATTYHETDKTMQPIKERGGNAYFIKKYWTNQNKAKELGNRSAQEAVDYSGKGLVQITGRANYIKMGKLLGIDLVNQPDLALRPDYATEIMFEGMTTGKSFKGDFTGKHLSNYFNKTTDDPVNARKIINGLDKAKLISVYHYKFLEALKG